MVAVRSRVPAAIRARSINVRPTGVKSPTHQQEHSVRRPSVLGAPSRRPRRAMAAVNAIKAETQRRVRGVSVVWMRRRAEARASQTAIVLRGIIVVVEIACPNAPMARPARSTSSANRIIAPMVSVATDPPEIAVVWIWIVMMRTPAPTMHVRCLRANTPAIRPNAYRRRVMAWLTKRPAPA
jgi:hypothetical protein